MTRAILGLGWALACAVFLPALASGQSPEIHGENSVFAAPGVAVAWGVLRGPSEDATQVVLRLVATGPPAYPYVGVDAVDPFTGTRRPVLAPRPLGEALDVRSPRATFADFPRREIRLFRTADDARAGAPGLTVYYLGVPDTTPEFTSEPPLLAYLADAVAKVRAASGGRAP